jgi:hypothetical protein
MDVRKAEIEQMESTCNYLATQYPKLFEVSEYEHPVFGVRKQFKIITESAYIDVHTIQNILINFEGNLIVIQANKRLYTITKFIEDNTVL